MSSLSDSHLPNELLLVIFSYLESDDLRRLIDVSPRFCDLSLIIYFAKHHVPISSDGQVDLPSPTRTKEILPLIPKARFITSINRLSCVFAHPHKSLLENISDATTALKHVESVQELTIDFFTSGETWTSALIKQVNARNSLSRTLSELFVAAARVSQSITVRNGTSLRGVIQKAQKSSGIGRRLSWSFGPVTRLFSSDIFKKKRPTCPTIGHHHPPCPSISSGVSNRGVLHKLDINSILLISPPFLDWTIQTINCNDITELTFGTIEFRDVNWSSLLPQIHSPALKSLTFRGLTPFGDLVTFMGRHENITTLTINNINFNDWSAYLADNILDPAASSASDKLLKAFANIKRLACGPQGLVNLLSGALHPNDPNTKIFPNLRIVSVLWSLGIGQQFRKSAIGDILAPIADKLETYEKVVFVVMYRGDVGSAWRVCPHPILIQRSTGFRRRSFIPSNASNALAVNGTTHTSWPLNPSASLFTAFTEIRFEVTPWADRDGIPSLVRALADTFTNIRHFKVDTRARVGRPTQENKLMKLYLCHHVLKHFKHLKAVYIDGVRSKVVEKRTEGYIGSDLNNV